MDFFKGRYFKVEIPHYKLVFASQRAQIPGSEHNGQIGQAVIEPWGGDRTVLLRFANGAHAIFDPTMLVLVPDPVQPEA